jgi:hypothetical protein
MGILRPTKMREILETTASLNPSFSEFIYYRSLPALDVAEVVWVKILFDF